MRAIWPTLRSVHFCSAEQDGRGLECNVRIAGELLRLTMPAHSIASAIIDEGDKTNDK